MEAVKEIEEAIARLPKNELAVLREWFDKFDAQKWDKQFENDVQSGRLDDLANKAIADFHAGKCKEL